MVGTTGFEPATSWPQTKCSTRLSYVPSAPLCLLRLWEQRVSCTVSRTHLRQKFWFPNVEGRRRSIPTGLIFFAGCSPAAAVVRHGPLGPIHLLHRCVLENTPPPERIPTLNE